MSPSPIIRSPTPQQSNGKPSSTKAGNRKCCPSCPPTATSKPSTCMPSTAIASSHRASDLLRGLLAFVLCTSSFRQLGGGPC